ncbi:MAG: hypothetical protein M1824_006495 [Vezdaea acicularis]|nr:MAG: hypothetical protein M1824_006495 [Vezdaea acicularis]
MVQASWPEGAERPPRHFNPPPSYYERAERLSPPNTRWVEPSDEELEREDELLTRAAQGFYNVVASPATDVPPVSSNIIATSAKTTPTTRSTLSAEASVDPNATKNSTLTSSGVRLAPGWSEQSSNAGETYYLNSATGKSTSNLWEAQGPIAQLPEHTSHNANRKGQDKSTEAPSPKSS